MPPERAVPRFAAEPPQEPLPYGRFADTLRAELLSAVEEIEEDVGELGDVVWFPDRTYNGRTYVPATARTSTGVEVFGYVSYALNDEPGDYEASADWTDNLAEENPGWKVDVCEEVIAPWRGDDGHRAQMTLVWGVPLVDGGAVATAELGHRITVTVDQCALNENRFTLIAPDDYRGDTLSVKVWSGRGQEIARESLYEDE